VSRRNVSFRDLAFVLQCRTYSVAFSCRVSALCRWRPHVLFLRPWLLQAHHTHKARCSQSSHFDLFCRCVVIMFCVSLQQVVHLSVCGHPPLLVAAASRARCVFTFIVFAFASNYWFICVRSCWRGLQLLRLAEFLGERQDLAAPETPRGDPVPPTDSGVSPMPLSFSLNNSHIALAKYWRPPKRSHYECLHQEELVDVACDKDETIRLLRAELRLAKRHCSSTPSPSGSDVSALALVSPACSTKSSSSTSWDIVRCSEKPVCGRKSRHLTDRASLVISIRRNLSNVAASSFGLVVLDDVSRQVVTRCEIHSGACQIASFRFFHRFTESAMLSVRPERATNHVFISCHDFSSDATNSGIWRNSKLQGLQLRSSYLADHASTATTNNFLKTIVSFESFADIQCVPSTSTCGTLGIILKQLISVGCPMWRRHNGVEKSDTSLPHGNHIIRLFFYTSDGGPDQAGFKKVLLTETMADARVIVIVVPCFMHVLQLIIRSGLVCVDRWYSVNECFVRNRRAGRVV
jgi:hypothetical protein